MCGAIIDSSTLTEQLLEAVIAADCAAKFTQLRAEGNYSSTLGELEESCASRYDSVRAQFRAMRSF